MADEKLDLAKAAERLAEAQEGVKLAHAAYQTCTKAWDGIRGPSDAKRLMWKALEAARASFTAAMRTEAKHFGVMQQIVGQGELFNGDGPVEEPAPPDEPPGPRGGAPKSTAVVPRGRKRGGKSPGAGAPAN